MNSSFTGKRFLLMDCGSTTTKALLFTQNNSAWVLKGVVNTPTTVEAPSKDVTIGVLTAFKQMANVSDGAFTDINDTPFIATSSAGGGLQVAVIGLTTEISTKGANQAALNAGAIVSFIDAADTTLSFSERVKLLQEAGPDIVVIAGGLDTAKPLAMSETLSIIKEAKLRPRYGSENQLPIIYCGTQQYIQEVKNELGSLYDVMIINNLSPQIEFIDDIPVKNSIQDLFLSSVMNHAPGYAKLSNLVTEPIIPTPMAVTKIVQQLTDIENIGVLAVDIGGATTDIYTALKGKHVQRSVSANFGMSYSAASVLHKGGLEKITQYCGKDISASDIETYIWNKTLYPTVNPIEKKEIIIEQAICRVALQLSYAAHHEICGNELPTDCCFDLCIASGGVLSHAPDPIEIPWIMADGFDLLGISKIAVDKIFMMPHLGALSEVDTTLAVKLLYQECLVPLGWLVGVRSQKRLKPGSIAARIYIDGKESAKVIAGKRAIATIEVRHHQTVSIKPEHRSVHCGAGKGMSYEYTFTSDNALSFYLDGMRC